MRKVAIPALTFAALVLLAASGTNPSIYYRSQAEADANLARYDLDSPSCQLWTNWQKMCSRTGKDGSTICKRAAVRVKPSVPFCSARLEYGFLGLSGPYDQRQLGSYLRFCATKTGELTTDGVPLCNWSNDRPFNGLRSREIAHPWCRRWRADPVRLRKSANAHLAGYYCSDRAVPDWCVWPEGLGYGRQDGVLMPEGDYIAVLNRPSSITVHGVYCRRKATVAKQ